MALIRGLQSVGHHTAWVQHVGVDRLHRLLGVRDESRVEKLILVDVRHGSVQLWDTNHADVVVRIV